MTSETTAQAQQDIVTADGAETVPKHVGIIMDGNHRWAKKRHLPGAAGHREQGPRACGLLARPVSS